MTCECEAQYGRACTGLCTQEIMPAVLEGLCPQCKARLTPTEHGDGRCPNGHGCWQAQQNADGTGSYTYTIEVDTDPVARMLRLPTEMGFTMKAEVDPDLWRLLAGET